MPDSHQSSNLKSNIQTKEILIGHLEKLNSKRYPFENNKYHIVFSIENKYKTARPAVKYLEINDFCKNRDLKIEIPLSTIIIVNAEVFIPFSIMKLNENSSGGYNTKRKIPIVIKYRSSSAERYRMDLDDFEETYLEIFDDLIENFEKNCPDIKNDPAGHKNNMRYINKVFGPLYFQPTKVYKVYKNRDNLSKEICRRCLPYVVTAIFNKYSKKSAKLLHDLNEKPSYWDKPRKHFCYKGLSDYDSLKHLYKDVSEILFKRFKWEQKSGIIPGSEKAYKDQYIQERTF